jgi:cell division protein FtsL
MARSAAAVAAPARRRARDPGHGTRRHGAGRPRPAPGRRASGPALASIALPLRVLEAPFTRAIRARVGRLLDALLAGRGWIALMFVLLAGIVFFNVDLLQMNRDIAQNAERVSAFKRENARLRLEAARLGSSERIQEAAARLGLVLPAPGQVRYLKAHPRGDAKRAARRMTEPAPTAPPAPVATAPDPAAATPGATDTTYAPTTSAPTGTTTTPPAPSGTTTPPTGTTPTTPPTDTTAPAPTGTGLAGTTTTSPTTTAPSGY